MKSFIGIDEVGRGALAGPVVVGAVLIEGEVPLDILAGFFPKGMRDSKRTQAPQREVVAQWVRETFSHGVGVVSAGVVDSQGLSAALRQAAGLAITQAQKGSKGEILVQADAGLFHPFEETLPTIRTVKGDETILSILLASHVAKVYRDNLMYKLAETHPGYGWENNVGYGTQFHREAIKRQGSTLYHRQSFLKGL